MRDVLNGICEAVGDFSVKYGWYIVCFCAGYLIGMLAWWKRRPEDFINMEDSSDDCETIDER